MTALVGALMLAAATAAQAADPPPAAPPAAPKANDPEAIAAALALLGSADIDRQLMSTALRMANVMLEGEVDSYRKQGVEMPQQLVDRMRALVLGEVKAMVDSMAGTYRSRAAAIYARYFTAAELRELKRLQDNPVSQKMQQLLPQLMEDLSKIGLDAASARRPEMERKAKELVEEWLRQQQAAQEGPKT
ncbi:MAG: hypothetical protein ACM3YM_11910 [Sphingomonadales bacterium]